jgi:hypothetical protein
VATCIILFYTFTANAKTFTYRNNIKIIAEDYNTAAKLCFNQLTNGRYPGEEKGLTIIDICSNPKQGEVK